MKAAARIISKNKCRYDNKIDRRHPDSGRWAAGRISHFKSLNPFPDLYLCAIDFPDFPSFYNNHPKIIRHFKRNRHH
jgi:hypothetical protein